LSKEEVDALVAPHPDSTYLVESWLAHHEVDSSSAIQKSGGGEWLTLRIPVAKAEEMLGAHYSVYHNPSTSDTIVRTLGYSLPRVLHGHVDLVTPTTYFGSLQPMKVTSFLDPDIPPLLSDALPLSDILNNGVPPAVPSSCNRTITPSCLMLLYNTTCYEPAATDKNTLGVAGYLNQFANHADLKVTKTNQVL
jgi:tripeptidyl-peptidase I